MSHAHAIVHREKPCLKCGGHRFTAKKHSRCYDCKLTAKRAQTAAAAEEEDVAPLHDFAADIGVDPESFGEEHLNRSDDDSEVEDENTGKKVKRPPRSAYRPKACLYCNRTRQQGVVVATGKPFQTCCKQCRGAKGKLGFSKHSKDCDHEEYVDVWYTPGLNRDDIEGFMLMARLRARRKDAEKKAEEEADRAWREAKAAKAAAAAAKA